MGTSEEPEKGDKTSKPCQHHWVIESTYQKTSWGKCKYCGITREFLNTFDNDFASTFKKKFNNDKVTGKNN